MPLANVSPLSAKQIDRLGAAQIESQEARDYRHVVRKTTLRLEPVARSLPIRTVFPDELTRVLEARGPWAKVEVHEYATDQVTIGWIARSRLASPD